MRCTNLVCAKNHSDGIYHILKLCTNQVIIVCGMICMKNTYGKYFARIKYSKANGYVLKDKNTADMWSHIKIDTVNTKDLKIDQDNRENIACIRMFITQRHK